MLDDLHDSILYTLNTICRNQHLHAGLVFRTEAFGRDRNAELIAGNDLRVDHTRRIVLCILSVKKGLRNNRFAQVPFRISLCNSLVDRILQEAAGDMEILPDLHKYNGHPCVLAIWTILLTRDLSVANDLIQDNPADGRLLGLSPLF